MLRRRSPWLVLAVAVIVALARSQGCEIDPALLEGIGGDVPVAAGEGLAGCRVTRVVDGDTLHADCDGRREKVRLLRVDTPERDEPGYGEGRRELASRVDGRRVRLVFEDQEAPERDDYGRLLAYVWLGDSHVNVEIVRSGWSAYFTRYGKGRFRAAFESAEREARDARRGLWRGAGR